MVSKTAATAPCRPSSKPRASAYTTFASTDKLNAVPEPVSIATFGLGAGAIAFIRRRRKQA